MELLGEKPTRLLIRGGQLVDPGMNLSGPGSLLIENSKIKAVGPEVDALGAEILDVTGCLVIPGLIDMHVHLRDPGFEWKEDIRSGSRAAAAGGFVGVACMANTEPPLDDSATIRYVLERASRESVVEIFPVGAITKGRRGEELAEIGYMVSAGAVAFSDDGAPVRSAELMRRALEYSKQFNVPIIDHCEDKDMSGRGVVNYGNASLISGLAGIPKESEEVIVARDLILARMTGGKLHLAHLSSGGSVKLLQQFKSPRISAEVTPHHLTLSEEFVITSGYDTNAKVNPPLRSKEDIEALVSALQHGLIDVIATDHAPHHVDDKDVEFDYAEFGISGLETAVPVVFTHLVKNGRLTLERFVAALSINPARILGLKGKGSLAPGSDANITIVDPEKKARVEPERFYSKGKNTPFAGMYLHGWPVCTVVHGKVVMLDGKVI